MSDNSTSFTSKGFIISAFLLVAVLAAGVVLLVLNKPAAASSTNSPSASDETSQGGAESDELARDQALFRLPYEGDAFALNSRVCPPTQQTEAQVAFEVLADSAVTRWTDEGSGIKTPRSLIGDGPNLVNDAGMPICYTKTYEGAALAALNQFPLFRLDNQLRPAGTYLYRGELAHSNYSQQELTEYTKVFEKYFSDMVTRLTDGQTEQVKNAENLGYSDETLKAIAQHKIQYKSVKVSSNAPNILTTSQASIVKVSLEHSVGRTDFWLIWNNVKGDWFTLCASGDYSTGWASRSPACSALEQSAFANDVFEVNLS